MSYPGSHFIQYFMCDMFMISKTHYFPVYPENDTAFANADNIKDIIQSLKKVSENHFVF